MSASWLGLSHDNLADAGHGHRLHADALPAFYAMQQAAAEQGIDCQLVSSYRNFDRQLAIWNRKWQGELPILDIHGQVVDINTVTDEEKMHSILTWSALPGTSRHHWGTDIDVYDRREVTRQGLEFNLVDSEYRPPGPCAALAGWLEDHAEDYGFYRPFLHYTGGVACELWHLSHRTTAKHYEQLRNCHQLADTLAHCPLAGKATVLEHIDSIFYRYALNKGV